MLTPGKIRLIPFFHSFDEAQLKAIIPFFIEKEFAVDEIVLQQKKINTRLYFLVSGSVDIVIDDKLIVTLNKIGEVFGEMSLANFSTCTATVKAHEPCKFYIFSFDEMKKTINPAVKDGVLKHFYQGAMEILANKLMNANNRSKG